jgi:hypothetical protein
MTTRLASCACGQLKASCLGEPVLVSLCHCRECQRRTGSVFGIAAFFACENAATEGQSRVYTRPSDSGHPVAFHFCPVCGGTVFWEPHRKPDLIAVATGAFADPAFPAPTQAVHGESRHPWVQFSR